MNEKSINHCRVFVGLSGGVDSSVSAALLKKEGYDVTGVFIKVWQPDWIECTWKEDRLDAMRVCAKLEIPFVTLDLSKEYKKEVVDYMIREYKAGKTPNPDVMCNRHVKFGGFFRWAMANGADYVATGHYSRVVPTREFLISNSKFLNKDSSAKNLVLPTNNYKLQTGLDSNKDQSYFLWTLTQKELSRTLFPVGGLEKSQVRKLAKKFDLVTAEKKDSQGLCFLGKIDVKKFLQAFIKTKRGKVKNEEGHIIGTHDGAVFFTLGERHGFSITERTTDQKPYYVIGKDVKRNILIVSNNPKEVVEGGSRKIFALTDVNWIEEEPHTGSSLLARIRHRQTLQKAKIIFVGNMPTIEFEESQDGGASGQSIVIYKKDTCLGGGIIV